jgi:hypothetical protein
MMVMIMMGYDRKLFNARWIRFNIKCPMTILSVEKSIEMGIVGFKTAGTGAVTIASTDMTCTRQVGR